MERGLSPENRHGAWHISPCTCSCALLTAIEGMTTNEFDDAIRKEKDGNLYMYISEHKAATAKVPAQLVIPDEIKALYDRSAEARRGRGTSNLFFVNDKGVQPSK